MGVDIWLVYIGTILILMSTPGPSQLLMLSNSISSGFHRSMFTAAGDLSANFIQMVVASVGLVGIISSSREFFVVVKWVGVMYLVYLGLRLIISKANNQLYSPERSRRSNGSLYRQGFITSATNPKAILLGLKDVESR